MSTLLAAQSISTHTYCQLRDAVSRLLQPQRGCKTCRLLQIASCMSCVCNLCRSKQAWQSSPQCWPL